MRSCAATALVVVVVAACSGGSQSHRAATTTTTTPTSSLTAAAPTANAPCGTRASPPATYQHVIWVWMENHRYDAVIGAAAAPFQTRLAGQCASATNVATVGAPSLPNYIGATSGQTFGIADDASPAAHALTSDNLFRQVRAAGGTAKSYQEDMASNCQITSAGQYAVKHNPAAYSTGDGDRAACQRDNVPMGTTAGGPFLDDLRHDTLPTLAFVTPNLCNDTHDCPVATGDAWLAGWVPEIVGTKAWARGDTALVISYDEYTPIPNVWVAPSVRPGARADASITLYALLRTVEEMLGIKAFLGGAATSPSVRSAFGI